jgi:hypothetical protein
LLLLLWKFEKNIISQWLCQTITVDATKRRETQSTALNFRGYDYKFLEAQAFLACFSVLYHN